MYSAYLLLVQPVSVNDKMAKNLLVMSFVLEMNIFRQMTVFIDGVMLVGV